MTSGQKDEDNINIIFLEVVSRRWIKGLVGADAYLVPVAATGGLEQPQWGLAMDWPRSRAGQDCRRCF